MEALNLDQKQVGTKQLRASQFPEPADVYVCDKCGRDITVHLYSGRAHVQILLRPSRYVCRCGQKYLSGAAEWDDLSDWERRQRWGQVQVHFVMVSALLAGSAILTYFAVTRRSIALLVLLVVE